ncbi:hypothetical protein HQ308_05285 [Rhodococcus sp. BP-241]|uniref:sigma factor-like helix-turn-helix DNA-binding protein n=1 Tax=Rhodococcus sp. BP-241 TaxID=2739441 RepID=UPI001C9A3215|nr:sigma factor-like helix-turn-helix DNA-binding protein [Rhodococcus sp. BP-241]MBY6706209.1 hypothetical protein [Rhodococcus sp. BP-241]
MTNADTPASESGPDSSTPRTWAGIFPHLTDSLYIDGRSVASESVEESSYSEVLVGQLEREIVDHRPTVPLGILLPSAPRHYTEKRLEVGPRAFTCLNRATDVRTLDGVLTKSVRELLDVRGAGLGTVESIVNALIRVCISGHQDHEVEHAVATATPEHSPAVHQLIDDVQALARWRRVRDQGSTPLFEVPGNEAVPEQLQEVLARLEALTAEDFPGVPEKSASETLALFYDGLDDRDRKIFEDRIISTDPSTLQSVADVWDVSRERVRQLESKLRTRVNELCAFGTPVGDLLASLRAEITPVASLERLLQRHPELRTDVPGCAVPLWQVLDGLDDDIKVTDGWAATPDTEVAKTTTREFLLAFADDNGVVDPKSLPAGSLCAEDELDDWLSWCGYDFFRGRILTSTRNLGDHSVSILSVHGETMSAEDIFSAIGKDRSFRSFLNQLSVDPRVTRVGKTEWALTSWEVEEYGSIRAQIARVLDEHDGTLGMDRLAAEISSRFGVTESSVRTYASMGEFVLEKGVVSRRSVAAVPRKTPEETRGLYRDGSVWRLAIVANKDHLRGSGFAVPSGVARLLGVEYGMSTELHSRLGAQAIRWKGVQPGCGSIRRFLQDLNVVEGERLFLELHDEGMFDIVRAPSLPMNGNPIAAALVWTGRTDVVDQSDPDIIAGLAEALGIPGEDRPRRILSTARGRDETHLIELLESAWVTSGD